MPPQLAKSLPSIFLEHIFALNGKDFTHSSTVNSNGDNIHGLEDFMDMLASYPTLLSTLMIAMRKRKSQGKFFFLPPSLSQDRVRIRAERC